MTTLGKKIKIGHTTITWADADIEKAVSVISKLGYHGVETFGWVLDNIEKEGKSDVFEKYDIPLLAAYYSVDITDPNKSDEAIQKVLLWSELLQKQHCEIAVLGGNGVDRKSFHFHENKKYIVGFVNELGKRMNDMGINCCFHPHTGTPVEKNDEITSFMDAVDTRYVFFSPDVGQIQKGGADPVKIVENYVSTIKHVHLKDFIGGSVQFDKEGKEIDSTGFACYTPLGEGVVDIHKIMDILEASNYKGYIMGELDKGKTAPISQEKALEISKRYMEKLGYEFLKR